MGNVSWLDGWKIFLRVKKFPSLQDAAEEMYRLNVFARHCGRHVLVDQIYTLKDNLIKYLYQHRYSVEVKLHYQNRICHSCGGTGEFWTGAECNRCDGTGIYSTTQLYAFRFDIGGRHYAWHQLKRLVDYEVTLTDDSPAEQYKEPLPSGAILSMEQAWAGCCVVWWALLWRGVKAEFLLFPATWARIQYKIQEIFEKKEVPF